GLLFSALTNTCAMGMLLAKLPYNRGPECVVDDVLAQMQAPVEN
ncbi:MAG: sulfurtransferase, partial [Acidimicrobiaceae bacterium]|nr:sulfurtransferase [Acidimicrobiaceae bacterium]